jgi:hypothetical protein
LKAISAKSPNPDSNTYVGTDINTRFFPTGHPSSFQFYQHNVAEPWPESEHNKYDIVYQRLSLPGAAPESLAKAVKNLFDLVKPGGWIQLVEAEQLGPDSGPVFEQFLDLVKLVFDTTGAGWKYAFAMREWVTAAGAEEIGETSVDMAFGAAHKNQELAEKGATCTAGAIGGLAMHVKSESHDPPYSFPANCATVMGLKTGLADEVLDSMADRLLVELRETGAHYPLRAVWGRKKL